MTLPCAPPQLIRLRCAIGPSTPSGPIGPDGEGVSHGFLTAFFLLIQPKATTQLCRVVALHWLSAAFLTARRRFSKKSRISANRSLGMNSVLPTPASMKISL